MEKLRARLILIIIIISIIPSFPITPVKAEPPTSSFGLTIIDPLTRPDLFYLGEYQNISYILTDYTNYIDIVIRNKFSNTTYRVTDDPQGVRVYNGSDPNAVIDTSFFSPDYWNGTHWRDYAVFGTTLSYQEFPDYAIVNRTSTIQGTYQDQLIESYKFGVDPNRGMLHKVTVYMLDTEPTEQHKLIWELTGINAITDNATFTNTTRKDYEGIILDWIDTGENGTLTEISLEKKATIEFSPQLGDIILDPSFALTETGTSLEVENTWSEGASTVGFNFTLYEARMGIEDIYNFWENKWVATGTEDGISSRSLAGGSPGRMYQITCENVILEDTSTVKRIFQYGTSSITNMRWNQTITIYRNTPIVTLDVVFFNTSAITTHAQERILFYDPEYWADSHDVYSTSDDYFATGDDVNGTILFLPSNASSATSGFDFTGISGLTTNQVNLWYDFVDINAGSGYYFSYNYTVIFGNHSDLTTWSNAWDSEITDDFSSITSVTGATYNGRNNGSYAFDFTHSTGNDIQFTLTPVDTEANFSAFHIIDWNDANLYVYDDGALMTNETDYFSSYNSSSGDVWIVWNGFLTSDVQLLNAPLGGQEYDYVDNDTTDIDSSSDIGNLYNFSDVQSAPDSTYSKLNETLVNSTYTQDYVDSNTSNVDGVTGNGTHSNFNNMKASDSTYDTLTEADNGGGSSNSTMLWDTMEGGLGNWTYTSWAQASDRDHTTGSGNSAKLSAENSDQLTLTNAIDLSDASDAFIDIWINKDDIEPNEFNLEYYTSGTGWVNIVDFDTLGGDDTWLQYHAQISNTYWTNDFKIRVNSNPDKNENVWVDDVEIIKTTGGTNYELDLEVQFTSVGNYEHADIRIETGTGDAEDIIVNIWNTTSSGWDQIFSDLTASSWNNVSLDDSYLASTMTFQFLGGTEVSDSTQSDWDIDAMLLYVYNDTYRLDQEMSWTTNQNNTDYAEICIYAGTMDTEDLEVQIWNKTSTAWEQIFSDLTASSWNNVSVKDYLTDDQDVYIRYLDGNQTAEDSLSSAWFLDSVVLHTWNTTGTAYSRTITQSLTFVWTGLRVTWSTTKTIAQTLTMSFNNYRDWTLLRTIDQPLTFTFNNYRDWTLLRSITQALTFTFNNYRDWTLLRTITQALTMSFNYYREWTLLREITQALTMSFNTYRDWTLLRTISQSLTFTWNGFVSIIQLHFREITLGLTMSFNNYRDWTLLRSITQALTMSFNTYREWTLLRLVQQSLTFSWDNYRDWTLLRAISQSLTFTWNNYRELTILRTITQGLTFTFNNYRDWTLQREITQALTFSFNNYREWTLLRTITQALTMSFNTYRDWTLLRTITQGLTFTFNNYREWTLLRSISQSLIFTWNGFVFTTSQYLREITLGLTFTFNNYRDWTLLRTITQGLTFTWNGFSEIYFLRTITLALSMTFNGLREQWITLKQITQGLTFTFTPHRDWTLLRGITQSLTFTWNGYVDQFLEYLFDLQITDSLTGISNVTVQVLNGATILWQGLTGSNGSIVTQSIREGNYSLFVEMDGYLPYESLINLNENIDWVVALTSIDFPTLLSMLIGVAVVFTWLGWKAEGRGDRITGAGLAFLMWTAVMWKWAMDAGDTSDLLFASVFLAPMYVCMSLVYEAVFREQMQNTKIDKFEWDD